MSIKYLLDGYNIIHQMPGPYLAKLEDRRWHLIRFIERSRPQGSAKNSVTIVFDSIGNLESFGGMASATVQVVFSQGESADDRIKKIVAQASNKKNITVVTDDRAVQYAIRALGAKASGVKAFLSQGKNSGPQNPGTDGAPSSEKYISKRDEAEITSEMQKIWLKPGHGNGD
jgi:predicted RNA-binding protein with PIN domain